jgi:hypothetical protein
MSNNPQNPVLLHAYPSNSGTPAFAMEIYWSLALADDSNGYLVNALKIVKWHGWFDEYMKKHDVRVDNLIEYGTEPSVICRDMNKKLEGNDVFTSEVERTTYLLEQVFAVTDEKHMNFKLKPLDALLHAQLRNQKTTNFEVAKRLKKLEEIARNEPHQFTGGAFEMIYLKSLWKLVLQNK